MEEKEKMVALKKAYADIILNTAKEAAARIMVSERKAQQAFHDHASMKNEAARLFSRLKQTMETKLGETEKKSLHQQRRIELLEAQLQEAEDIVSDLRAELNEVYMRLDKMKKKNMHDWWPNIKKESVCDKGIAVPKSKLPESVLVSQMKVLNNAVNGNCIANNVEKSGCAGVTDVPSIIERSKKPEMYRNRCTQRICACEGNLLNGHFPHSGELDYLKNEKIIREDKESERVYGNPPTGVDLTCIVGKKLVDVEGVEDVDKTRCNDRSIVSILKRRKRGGAYRSNVSVLKSVPLVTKKVLYDLSNLQTFLPDSHDVLKNLDNEETDIQPLSSPPAPSNVSEMCTLPERVGAVQGGDKFSKASTNARGADKEVANSLVLIREQNGSENCLDVPNSNPELDMMDDASSLSSDAKMLDSSEGSFIPPRKDRVLKYTFQRKRKKETLCSDDSCLLPEENSFKRKMGMKQNGSFEPSEAAESSRDSRRMAQVARQLISLSEKKWWK